MMKNSVDIDRYVLLEGLQVCVENQFLIFKLDQGDEQSHQALGKAIERQVNHEIKGTPSAKSLSYEIDHAISLIDKVLLWHLLGTNKNQPFYQLACCAKQLLDSKQQISDSDVRFNERLKQRMQFLEQQYSDLSINAEKLNLKAKPYNKKPSQLENILQLMQAIRDIHQSIINQGRVLTTKRNQLLLSMRNAYQQLYRLNESDSEKYHQYIVGCYNEKIIKLKQLDIKYKLDEISIFIKSEKEIFPGVTSDSSTNADGFITLSNLDIRKLTDNISKLTNETEKFTAFLDQYNVFSQYVSKHHNIQFEPYNDFSELAIKAHNYATNYQPLIAVISDKNLVLEEKLAIIERLAYQTHHSGIHNLKNEYKDLNILQYAVKQNQPQIAELLITCDKKLKQINDKEKLIHLAVINDSLEMVQILNSHKLAYVSVKRDKYRKTPLHLVKSVTMAKYLKLILNADPSLIDASGHTPLHTQCLFQFFTPSDNDPQKEIRLQQMKNVLEILEYMLSDDDFKKHINVGNECGHTPLHLASTITQYAPPLAMILQRINMLLEAGANPDSVTRKDRGSSFVNNYPNMTPLNIALQSAIKYKLAQHQVVDIAKVFFKFELNKNLLESSLDLAIGNNHYQLAKFLVKNGVPVNYHISINKNPNALFKLVRSDNRHTDAWPEMLKCLLLSGVKTDSFYFRTTPEYILRKDKESLATYTFYKKFYTQTQQLKGCLLFFCCASVANYLSKDLSQLLLLMIFDDKTVVNVAQQFIATAKAFKHPDTVIKNKPNDAVTQHYFDKLFGLTIVEPTEPVVYNPRL